MQTLGGTVKARSAQQVPASECWDKEFITSCRGLPWNPREDSSREHLGSPPRLGPGMIRGCLSEPSEAAEVLRCLNIALCDSD